MPIRREPVPGTLDVSFDATPRKGRMVESSPAVTSFAFPLPNEVPFANQGFPVFYLILVLFSHSPVLEQALSAA